MRRILLLPLFLILAGLAGCAQHPTGPRQAQPTPPKPGEVGSSLPKFSVSDLQGHPVTSADLYGKVVVIDFWATWCQPCKKEMPGYQALLDKYRSRGFAVIGFKFDNMADTEDPVTFARKLGVSYPLAVASDELKNEFGGIEGLPTTLLYDRKGILRAKIIGFEYTSVIEQDLQPLL